MGFSGAFITAFRLVSAAVERAVHSTCYKAKDLQAAADAALNHASRAGPPASTFSRQGRGFSTVVYRRSTVPKRLARLARLPITSFGLFAAKRICHSEHVGNAVVRIECETCIISCRNLLGLEKLQSGSLRSLETLLHLTVNSASRQLSSKHIVQIEKMRKCESTA